MDIAITEKKSAPQYKRYLVLVLIAIPIFFAIKYLLFLGQADFSIDRDALVFGEVKQGPYTVSVRGTGLLVPDKLQWLSAETDATVLKVVVKAGNVVKTGDIIVELSNPQLVQQFAEAQWELEALESELKAAKVEQESVLQQQKTNKLNAKMDYEHDLNEYNAYKKVLQSGAVSQLSFDRARVTMDQSRQRHISSEEQYLKMQENLLAQNKARVARLKISKKRLERFQQQFNNLQVKATMDSIVLEMPLQIGQRIMTGSPIAKLAQQNSLIAELKVPEIQIRDVAVGQKTVIDTRNNKIEGVVSRVDPAVINGNVQVDITFSTALPDDARPDLSVDGEIKITEINNTLYVDRPLFVQSKSAAKMYALSKDNKFAQRVQVEVGYGSVNQIQIIKGLQVGDKIITSDPTRFQSYDKFRIK